MAYIKDVQVGSDIYLIEPTLYIAPTKNGAAYTATLANFSLATGATVQAKFAATNNENATLNVNSTGAKEIHYNGDKITANQFKVNHVYTLVYDGTQWQVVGDIDTNTNTWRGIQDNLTSDSTTESLSAKQGKVLKGLIDAMDATTPAASGNATAFIDSITQTDGKITSITKKNIPTVSSSTAGLAPKGEAVSSQSQSTKFLRSDGQWVAPSYTVIQGTAGDNLISHLYLSAYGGSIVSYDSLKHEYIIAPTPDKTSGVTGLTIANNKVYIPWGYNFILSCEIYSTVAASFNYDENTALESGYTGNHGSNDWYNNHKGSSTSIPANTWTKVWYSHSNTDETKNPNHGGIWEYSYFGITMNDNTKNKQFKIRNVYGYFGTDTSAYYHHNSFEGIKNITRSGTTFTATRLDDSTFTFSQQDARTIWGQNFDGSANVTGSMTDVGPSMKLPENKTTFEFLTSGSGAANGQFGRLGLYNTYANADLTNYVLDVGGKVRIKLPNTDTNSKEFIITGSNNKYISLHTSGIQAYDSSNNASLFYLQYNGGNLQIGSDSTASATRDFYGTFNFKSANGFTYSGMAAGSDNAARPIWFSYNGIVGRPVYDNDFKYNPSTNTLTIGTGTLTATNYSGTAAVTTKSTVTAHTNTTNGSKNYYPWFSTATSGNLGARAHAGIYIYETVASGAISSLDFCMGSSTITGSITLWDGTNHWGNIRPTNLSANRNYTLPNQAGTFALLTQTDANALINLLSTGTSDLTTNDYVITQYVGGGTTNITYYRRPASKVVNATLVKAALGTVSTTAKKFLKDTGDWAQVAWGDLTDVPSSFTPSSHEHNYIGKDHYIAYPSDGTYEGESNAATGYIKIRIPETKSATMFSFDVDIYNYVDDTTTRYHIAGYNYSNASWNHCTAYCIAPFTNEKANLPVRFLSNGNDEMYVTIGETDTSWSYPKVIIHNITLGHSNATLAKWKSGWTTTISNDAFDNTQVKRTITNTNIAYTSNNATTATTATNLANNPSIQVSTSNDNQITITAGGKTSSAYTIPYATSAGSVAWTNVSGKPIEFGIHAGALNTNGWKTMGARTSGAKIYISQNNNPAIWNSETYSASMVFGCRDTKGLIDCGYNSPIVTFGGASNAGSTDNDPKWYFKLSGTSGKTYTFPSDSKTLAASDGSNASGSWGISITGTAAKATADASGNTITSTYATKTEMNGLLAAANAMTFKGTLGTEGTITELPASHEAGDTYRVITAGTWAGKYCEEGTLIICVKDGTAASNDDWTSVETNEDGAVIGPSTATDNGIVLFSGNTGRIIKNSSKTLTTTAPSTDSSDTTIPTSKAVWTTVDTAITGLDVAAVGGGTGEYVSKISETDGKISATISTTSVSNTWTAGTTAGPKLATTVNGITGTAVTIPSASSTTSGIVTTAEQTFSGEKTLNGNLIPGANNTKTLGSTDAKWAKLYIGNANSHGDAYTPVYWNDGAPTAVTPIQYCEFTIGSGKKGVKLTHTAFTAASYVVQIVITSGESNLNSTIAWESAAGYINLTCSATSGAVSGYILVSRGGAITATATDIT